MTYRKQGKIRWAKLSRFCSFQGHTKVCREYSLLYKLHIITLFQHCKCKAPQKFSREKYIGWNPQKFSPVNFSPFTVTSNRAYYSTVFNSRDMPCYHIPKELNALALCIHYYMHGWCFEKHQKKINCKLAKVQCG